MVSPLAGRLCHYLRVPCCLHPVVDHVVRQFNLCEVFIEVLLVVQGLLLLLLFRHDELVLLLFFRHDRRIFLLFDVGLLHNRLILSHWFDLICAICFDIEIVCVIYFDLGLDLIFFFLFFVCYDPRLDLIFLFLFLLSMDFLDLLNLRFVARWLRHRIFRGAVHNTEAHVQLVA